jgi:hypothetical protein
VAFHSCDPSGACGTAEWAEVERRGRKEAEKKRTASTDMVRHVTSAMLRYIVSAIPPVTITTVKINF